MHQIKGYCSGDKAFRKEHQLLNARESCERVVSALASNLHCAGQVLASTGVLQQGRVFAKPHGLYGAPEMLALVYIDNLDIVTATDFWWAHVFRHPHDGERACVRVISLPVLINPEGVTSLIDSFNGQVGPLMTEGRAILQYAVDLPAHGEPFDAAMEALCAMIADIDPAHRRQEPWHMKR